MPNQIWRPSPPEIILLVFWGLWDDTQRLSLIDILGKKPRRKLARISLMSGSIASVTGVVIIRSPYTLVIWSKPFWRFTTASVTTFSFFLNRLISVLRNATPSGSFTLIGLVSVNNCLYNFGSSFLSAFRLFNPVRSVIFARFIASLNDTQGHALLLIQHGFNCNLYANCMQIKREPQLILL